MEAQKCQLAFCPTRPGYYQQKKENDQNSDKICFFCDKESLRSNYILREDVDNNIREMMNKHPYPDFDQGIHLLIMPVTHKELPSDFSRKELTAQSDAVRRLSAQLYATAYTQEFSTSWGKRGGQTVPHLHSHLIHYTKLPVSMPERMKNFKNPVIKNVEEAFNKTKELLESSNVLAQPLLQDQHAENKCLCCLVQKGKKGSDEENFVVARFEHNYVCLAHNPKCAGELAVVPNRHVGTIKDLLQGEWAENMALAMALFPIMRAYAHEKIRDCDGGNLYTKGMGAQTSFKKQIKHHLYTRVMPRTVIVPIPGSLDGNSCKIDCDYNDLLVYLQGKIDEIKGKLS